MELDSNQKLGILAGGILVVGIGYFVLQSYQVSSPSSSNSLVTTNPSTSSVSLNGNNYVVSSITSNATGVTNSIITQTGTNLTQPLVQTVAQNGGAYYNVPQNLPVISSAYSVVQAAVNSNSTPNVIVAMSNFGTAKLYPVFSYGSSNQGYGFYVYQGVYGDTSYRATYNGIPYYISFGTQ